MRPRLVILGAGRPYSTQSVTLDRRVLDWQLDAFASLDPEVEYVGGEGIDMVMHQFPHLTYHYNEHWQTTGAVHSLRLALEASAAVERDLYIAYSDILLRPALIASLARREADGVQVATDLSRRPSPQTESCAGGEFIGLVRVPAVWLDEFTAHLAIHGQALNSQRLSALVNLLGNSEGVALHPVDAAGLWGHVEDSRSIARFVLGTKAATLERLGGRLHRSSVLPLFYFTRRQWLVNREDIVARALAALPLAAKFIVRSSATDEDGFTRANAGKYHSELHVPPSIGALSVAIDKVFASYAGNDPADEVLVQPQLDNVVASGVAFTRMLGTGSPYHVLNYSLGEDTTAITSGAEGSISQIVARDAPPGILATLPETAKAVLSMVSEIEGCVGHDALDIEFAQTRDGALHTLQVRPLVIDDEQQDRNRDAAVAETLTVVRAAIAALDKPPPGQLGNRAIWSVMADWNPAEIIGITPSPLSFDLYRNVITDTIWAIQRREVGYRDLTGWPLMRAFGGHPYIDARASINSFIPSALPDDIAARIVNDGLEKLAQNPSLHDKIEFEIVPTCLDFAFCPPMDEVQDAYRTVTRSIIARADQDLSAVHAMESRLSTRHEGGLFADWIRSELSAARRGALVFAHLARAGFVAASLLRTAVAKGLLEPNRHDALLASITTVGGTMARNAWAVKKGELDREAFVRRFGHLRPGTYDISAPSYGTCPEFYVDPIIDGAVDPGERRFHWTGRERAAIDLALAGLDLGIDADGLLQFVRTAVSGREYAKFVFTKPLSAVLGELTSELERKGLSPEDRECAPLATLLDGATDIWSDARHIKELSLARRRQHDLTSRIAMPPIILRPDDIFAFRLPEEEPSFVTNLRAEGPLVVVDNDLPPTREQVAGKIVAIYNADPGFDYLFALGIAGLITAYGGPNSHMAIRASEFSIPAVMGIGSKRFRALAAGRIMEIDGQKRRWLCVS